MESKYGPYGLRKQHTYDELVGYIKADPHRITYPDRKGLQMYSHPYYGALLDNLRKDEDIRLNNEQKWLDYRKSNDPAPYEPFALPDSPFVTPVISEAGESPALIDVIENEEIPRPYVLPPLVDEDPMAQGLLREGIQPTPSMIQRAASGASSAAGRIVDAGMAAANSQMTRHIARTAGNLAGAAFDRITDISREDVDRAMDGINNALDAAAVVAPPMGMILAAGGGTPDTVGGGAIMALMGGARLIAGAVMRNRNRPMDQQDLIRDQTMHAIDHRRNPIPLRPFREANGMIEDHRPIDRRPARLALPAPATTQRAQEFYIGHDPFGAPDTPPTESPDFDPLVLPGTRVTMQADPNAPVPLPRSPPAYNELARQGRARLTDAAASSSSSSRPMPTNRNHRPAGRHRNRG